MPLPGYKVTSAWTEPSWIRAQLKCWDGTSASASSFASGHERGTGAICDCSAVGGCPRWDTRRERLAGARRQEGSSRMASAAEAFADRLGIRRPQLEGKGSTTSATHRRRAVAQSPAAVETPLRPGSKTLRCGHPGVPRHPRADKHATRCSVLLAFRQSAKLSANRISSSP
jgi:hypothetical protein